ncbi:MAG: hypothetical protein WD512_15970, partial [Candidatus Paceibacterota bacterium]
IILLISLLFTHLSTSFYSPHSIHLIPSTLSTLSIMNNIINQKVNYIDPTSFKHPLPNPLEPSPNPFVSQVNQSSPPAIAMRYMNLWNITSLDQAKKHVEFSQLYYHGILLKVIYFMKKITDTEFNDLTTWFNSQDDHKYQIMQQISYLAYTSKSVNL